ncbi:hypothetical protein C0995_015627 [Termitomyces sp. Mi166|nr:hypothetical protein C0995_015627 [Termitomyces sp. Mi166\
MFSTLRIWALYFTIGVARAALPACPDPANADYDYIVVGAGAGGGPLASRLVEAGYSVLVIDAGNNTVTYNTTIPAYSSRLLQDPQTHLNYTYQEYSTDFPGGFPIGMRHNSWYPRSRALGGSTISNAMVNVIAGTEQDFEALATTFNDTTWSRDNMQDYFSRIEDNLYLQPQSQCSYPDHGFNGWLKTSLLPLDIFTANPRIRDPQFEALATAQWNLPVIQDLNTRSADSASGVTNISFTIDEQHIRSSVHERLEAVWKSNPRESNPGKLELSLETLATKILLCNSGSGSGSDVTAYGVQIAPGAALPVAANFKEKDQNLHVTNVTARYEVIISAGVFQSPQLLMLSGIGNETHLSEFGIETVVTLPGVGTNLQDHDEVTVNWRLKNNYTLLDGCKALSDPAADPCLQYWLDNNHENGYAFPAVTNTIIMKSSSSPRPDVVIYWSPVFFPGFIRGLLDKTDEIHNGLTAVILKGHPSSKGTVKLTGSHPQDPLDIQKLHFQADGGNNDVAALREGIKHATELVRQLPIGSYVEEKINTGLTTDDDINKYIYERVYGHHACCTNPIGPDNGK